MFLYCDSTYYVLLQYMLCIVTAHVMYCDSTCFIVTIRVCNVTVHVCNVTVHVCNVAVRVCIVTAHFVL